MNILKRQIAAFMALAMLIGAAASFAPRSAAMRVHAASETPVVMVQADDSLPFLRYDGHSMGKRASITIDGETYPAFCVDPNLPGADTHPDSKYPIRISGTNMSPGVSTVLHNTLPYKTKAQLPAQFQALSDLEIYAATKGAVRSVDPQCASQYQDDGKWSGDNPLVLEFMRYLVNLAVSNPENVPKGAIYGTTDSTEVKESEDGNYLVKSVTVQSSNYPLTDGTKITFTIPPNAPAGTKVTLEDGSPLPADGVGNKTRIKIWAPKPSDGSAVSFAVEAHLKIASAVILSGVPESKDDKGKYQAYEVPMPSQPVSFDIAFAYSETPIVDPGTGGLQILKYDNVTGAQVPGAIFEVRGIDPNTAAIRFEIQATAGATVPGVANGATVTVGNGVVSADGLPAGKYQITELAPPPHYDMSPDAVYSQVVEVQASDVATVYPQVMFRNNPYGSLKITKIDAVSGQPVGGATLRIRNAVAGIDITRTADIGGVITLTDLPQGNYAITEVSAGADYELNPATVVMPVRWGVLAEAAFDNQPHTSFEVTKIDAKTNQPVSGAVFTLKQLATGKEWTLTTLAGGKAVANNIPAGQYTVREIYVPEPLILDSTVYNVQIDNDKINHYTARNNEKPTVTLEKYDEKTGRLLGGAEFRLEKLDGAWQTEFMVDASGKRTLTVEPGTYRFTEIAAPDGYLIAMKHKDFTLNPNDDVVIKFDNRPRPSLEILKVDEETSRPLAGAKFRVTATESKTTGEYVTGADGKITLPNLNEEIYSVEEIVAPSGYLLEGQHKDILLEWGKTKQLVFTNKARPKLRILKVDVVTGEPLRNAEFRVTKVEDKTVSEYITDASGEILIENLGEVIYSVAEFMPPNGYLLMDESKQIALEWGKTKTLKFDDVRKPNLVFTKLNALTSKPIANTVFRVDYEQPGGGTATLGTYRTGTDGRVVLPQVDVGWYVLTEIQASPGFSLPSNPVTRLYLAAGQNAYTAAELSGGNYIPSVGGTNGTAGGTSGTGTRASGVQVTGGALYVSGVDTEGRLIYDFPLNAVVIKKTDIVTGELLSGAAFELYRADEQVSGVPGTAIGRYTTDNSGIIVIVGLEAGFYVAKEVQAPTGYLISENALQNGFLKADGTTTLEFSFANIPYGSLLVSKVDAQTNRPLLGARFKVTDGTGTVVGSSNGEYVTDVNGEFIIPKLKPGAYTVTELSAPAGYALDGTPKTIAIGADGKTYSLTFADQPLGTLVLKKYNAVTNAPLAGAEFKVTTSDGAAVGASNGVFVTDATGTVTIPNLPKGGYIAQETKAPTGFILEQQTQTITVEYGQTHMLSFYNKPKSSLQVIKVDGVTKKPLKGAKFTVYRASGEVLGQYETDGDGLFIVDSIDPGWLKIVETKAPDGYIADDTPRDVEITSNQFLKLTFENQPIAALIVKKTDDKSGAPLAGAVFRVDRQDGRYIGEYTTDSDGTFTVPNAAPGWYVIREQRAPDGYLLDETAKTVEVKTFTPTVVTFTNKQLTALQIRKVGEQSGAPLSGAKFTVEKQTGERVGEYTTDNTGFINIPTLPPGWYVVRETKSPSGYLLDETPQSVEVKTTAPSVVTFTNKQLTALQIRKVDEQSGGPLAGATFTVEKQTGERVGEYTTDNTGFINIPTLQPGWFVVRETKAPSGYLLDETPQSVEVKTTAPTLVTFTNKKLTALEIIKTDEQTNEPLNGAVFVVERQNGERIGEFTTNERGLISIPSLAPDFYVVKEVKAPKGYLLNESPKTVEVKTYTPTVVKFMNQKQSGLQIIKQDAATGTPLPGAVFTVYKKSGEVIGDYITDANGVIIIDNLAPGWVKIAETKAPSGYLISESPKDVEVTHDEFLRVVFADERLAALQIKKVDAVSGAALAGAEFTVTKQNGERVGGTYITDASGFANIPRLAPDYYVVAETKAPAGYLLDSTPQTVQVKTNEPTAVTFSDKAIAGIQIVKVNSVTKGGIAGVQFSVTRLNGERVGSYTTGKDGVVYVPNLTPGDYIVTETVAAIGYVLDSTPHTVTVTWGKSTRLAVENAPASGLLIVKTDAATGRPLAGVKFDVRRYDGSFVNGSIIDQNQPGTIANSPNHTTTVNGDITGNYTTDANGRILINSLPAGRYMVIETKPLDGYERDTDVHDVTVTPGQQATLQLTNHKKAGLRIVKVDSVTKAPIYGTEFMLFDKNGNIVGRYITDDRGVIEVTGALSEGRYSIRETKAAPGYYLDETPRTIDFVSGKMTEIRWENVAQAGQLQIVKKSADDNEQNGLPAGTPLEGATFEVSEYKTGNLVDRFVSGKDGRAISKPLPLGRYIVREVQSPKWYKLSDKVLDIDVEFAGQIVKQEFYDYSANTGVSIRKTGVNETMPGSDLKYDIKEVRNTGTVSLTDFYWRDILPTEAIRLTRIVTGTYSQSMKYKVMAATNKGDSRVIADNLSTTRNNVIDCSAASLGLHSDEYIVSVTFLFGTVKAGFCQVETPQIYAKALPGLQNGMQFANKADVGGRYGSEWIVGNATWPTRVYAPVPGKLPRTGY